jgi:hypothetical protein
MIESLQENSILFYDLFIVLARLFLLWMKFSQIFPLAGWGTVLNYLNRPQKLQIVVRGWELRNYMVYTGFLYAYTMLCILYIFIQIF